MTEPSGKQRLCFVVTDGDEYTSIRFRSSDIAAKRACANELGCEIRDLSCTRKPEWDQYAEAGVPALARIDDGWWYECQGCGTKIDSDYIGTRERDSDDADDWDLRECGPDQSWPIHVAKASIQICAAAPMPHSIRARGIHDHLRR